MGKGGEQGEECGGGGGEREAPVPSYTWEEIQKHNLRADKWLVIERKVYNISQWAKRHPGGIRVISHYAGEDATVSALAGGGGGGGFLPGANGCCCCCWSLAAAPSLSLTCCS